MNGLSQGTGREVGGDTAGHVPTGMSTHSICDDGDPVLRKQCNGILVASPYLTDVGRSGYEDGGLHGRALDESRRGGEQGAQR
jgi:hypothetical protein